jgi:hypothetical protein
MNLMFFFLPLVLALIAFLIVAIIIYIPIAVDKAKNNRKEILSVPVRIVTKYHNPLGGRTGYLDAKYFVTFETKSGDRNEFVVSENEYGMLAEGDAGTLKYQGTRYHSFRRQRS